MKKFKVALGEAGRADIFVAKQYPAFSRSSLELLFNRGLVKHNSLTIKPGTKLKEKDEIAVDDAVLYQQPKIKLPVVFEDTNVMVIDKPTGVLTHSKGALNLEGTVASFIKPKLNRDLVGNRAGIVHRLDRGTSGLIIIAKNEQTRKFLQKQFSTRKVKKTYLAVIKGQLKPSSGIIDVPIARNAANPKKFTAAKGGKPAQTSYSTLSSSSGYSLIKLEPKTGRTHQLRVHLAFLNHPIIGDELYGGEKAERLMLHATRLELHLPEGQLRSFTSAPPKEFMKYE